MKFNYIYTLLSMLLLSLGSYAHVDLTNPEGGETFIAGDTIIIRWVQVQVHDTQNWELYYSPDGSDTWQTITTTIAVGTREFVWVVPEEETTEGRIRVVQNNSDTDFQDVSANFRIVQVTAIDEFDNNSQSAGSLVIFPNPFRSYANLRFTVYEKEHVTLNIYRANGAHAAMLINNDMARGEYKVTWKPEQTGSNTYFAILTVGNRKKSVKLQPTGP